MSEEKIKYKLGIVGGIYSKILFSQYPGVASGIFTLYDTVDNYKHIIICAQHSARNQHCEIKTVMIDTDMLRNSDTGILRIFTIPYGIGSLSCGSDFTFSGNILTITDSVNFVITEVIGIR